VKPYVKTNKSGYIDAEAIARSRTTADDAFRSDQTEEQLDLQAVHRVRERWVMRRTAVINQIRGLFAGAWTDFAERRSHLEEALPEILADAASKLSDSFRVLLAQLKSKLDQLTTGSRRWMSLCSRRQKK